MFPTFDVCRCLRLKRALPSACTVGVGANGFPLLEQVVLACAHPGPEIRGADGVEHACRDECGYLCQLGPHRFREFLSSVTTYGH